MVYTWNFHPDLVDQANRLGVHGYLSKALSARVLVTQGRSNAEVAAFTFLSPNTVKSYIRSGIARSTSRAGRRPCCGASSTASRPTTTASSTGAAAVTRPLPHRGFHRREGSLTGGS